MISRNEIVAIINTVYDAVNQSKAGPITITNEETGDVAIQSIGYNTFLYAVSKCLPVIMEANMVGDFTERKSDGTVIRHESTDEVTGAAT